MRPMLHLPVWNVIIFGYYSYSVSQSNKSALLLALAIGSGLCGAAFLLNQIYDIESDKLNNKLHFLPGQYVRIKTAWLMIILLDLFSLSLAFKISLNMGLIGISITLLGIFYSAPPIALKNRAWPAAIANGFGPGTLAFMLGYCAAGGLLPAGLIRSLPYFMAVISVYIGTTLPDIEGDRKTGKLTIGAVYGMAKSRYLMLSFYMLSLLSGVMLSDWPFLIAAFIAMPFFAWVIYNKSLTAVMLAVKASIISLSTVALGIAPLYAVALVLLILTTRAYYKVRFNMYYPSLK